MMLELDQVSVTGRLGPVSAQFAPGQITAICGPNGAGKSTLLALMAGLLEPASGAVLWQGQPLASLPRRRRAQALGYLPQHGEIAWDVSVRRLVGLGRLPHATGAAEDARAVAAALEAVALTALAERPCATLSGGERARALLARVLAGEPDWVLADEPLANLDLAQQLHLLGHFRRLAVAGAGVVLVLHDLAAAMNWADRVIVLNQGSLASDGPPDQALASPVLARVWQLQGEWLGRSGQRALALHLPG